jgi:hypothetical protein
LEPASTIMPVRMHQLKRNNRHRRRGFSADSNAETSKTRDPGSSLLRLEGSLLKATHGSVGPRRRRAVG